jgi:Tol biopolymer transport system component
VKFRTAWLIAGVTTVIAAVALLALLSQSKPEPIVKRFQVDATPMALYANWPELSPDGKYLAYRAGDSTGTSHIWIRPLNSLDSYMLPGTNNAHRPFWSPDSKYLAYMDGHQLKRIAIVGGPAQMIAEVPSGADGSWGTKGIIAIDGNVNDSIRAVKASGGNVTAVTRLNLDEGEFYHAWPFFLPDGEHFLFVSTTDSMQMDREYTLYVGSIDSEERKEITNTNSMAVYASPGYLLFVRNKILTAQAFDAEELQVIGEPIPITDNIRVSSSNGMINLSASNEGTLAMQTEEQGVKTGIRWISSQGVPGPTILDGGIYDEVALSPNDSLLAYTAEDETSATADIWVRNLSRNVSSRLTFDPVNHTMPIWTPSGDSIIYTQGDFPKVQTMIKPADGSGEARAIPFPDSMLTWVMTISPDGKRTGNMILNDQQPDIAVFSLENLDEPIMIADSKFQEYFPRFSPNGRYIAYMSDESGAFEVYVRRSDGKGGKWQVSSGGGLGPIWSKDGSKLFYYSPSNDVMVASVSFDGTFRSDSPKLLFHQPASVYGAGIFIADVTSDGKEWVWITRIGGARSLSFDIVLNWAEELKHR